MMIRKAKLRKFKLTDVCKFRYFLSNKVSTLILNPLTRVCVSEKLTDLLYTNSLFTGTFASSEQSNPYVRTEDGRAENVSVRTGKLRTGCSANQNAYWRVTDR